jgi:hypothetical protein
VGKQGFEAVGKTCPLYVWGRIKEHNAGEREGAVKAVKQIGVRRNYHRKAARKAYAQKGAHFPVYIVGEGCQAAGGWLRFARKDDVEMLRSDSLERGKGSKMLGVCKSGNPKKQHEEQKRMSASHSASLCLCRLLVACGMLSGRLSISIVSCYDIARQYKEP